MCTQRAAPARRPLPAKWRSEFHCIATWTAWQLLPTRPTVGRWHLVVVRTRWVNAQLRRLAWGAAPGRRAASPAIGHLPQAQLTTARRVHRNWMQASVLRARHAQGNSAALVDKNRSRTFSREFQAHTHRTAGTKRPSLDDCSSPRRAEHGLVERLAHDEVVRVAKRVEHCLHIAP